MMVRALETTAWLVVLSLAACAAAAVLAPSSRRSRAGVVIEGVSLAGRYDADSVRRAADLVAAGDPFRLSRRPPTVPFGTVAPIATTAPPPGRPQLVLRGIVGTGARWSAIVLGIPGHDGGALLIAGDTIGGLRVQHVTARTVTVVGADTAWTLSLKAPWQ